MDVNDLFPSKYLKASDADPALTVTIQRIVQETMKNRDGKEETKPVIFFVEHEKGMVLNRTNAKTLEDLFGTDTDNWISERVVLAAVEVDAFGETKPALRFKKETPAMSRPELVKRYEALYEKARKLKVDDLDTYTIAPDADEATIIELGKELRAKVSAAETF
jgi:hypothetical protein